jgi:hypothetical protein
MPMMHNNEIYTASQANELAAKNLLSLMGQIFTPRNPNRHYEVVRAVETSAGPKFQSV